MTLAQILNGWNDFFFKPQSPLPFAVFRILYGFLVLQCLLIQLLPDFEFWYGARGLVSAEPVMKFFWQQPIFDLTLLTGSNTTGIYTFFAVAVISAFCLMIGFGTRYSAIILFMCFVTMHTRQPFNLNGGDCFLRLAAFYLALSHAGEALSVDRWLKQKYAPDELKDEYWPWAQRLFQIQVALVYWQTSAAKLSGTQWIDGTAIWYATRLEDMMRFPIPFVFDSLLMCKILSWITVCIEVALWTLVWIKECRYWVLAAGLALHIAIDASISLPLFEWAFIYSYVTFIDPVDLKTFFAFAKSWRPKFIRRNQTASVAQPAPLND